MQFLKNVIFSTWKVDFEVDSETKGICSMDYLKNFKCISADDECDKSQGVRVLQSYWSVDHVS